MGAGLAEGLAELLSRSREKVVGIDLAGSEANPSGWAVLDGLEVRTAILRADDELIEATLGARPALVAIDAPLSLPEEGYMRKVDRELHRLGFPVLPPMFPAMKKLTLRGIRLAQELQALGLEVIEVHPASTRKALGLPVKGRKAVQEALLALGLKGDLEARSLSIHELDAVTAALTAALHLLGLTVLVGDEEGRICLPRRGLSLARAGED